MDAPQPPRSAARLAVPALVAACLLGTWASTAVYLRWASNREHLVALLERSGIASEDVLARVRREPVAHHAQLDAARALVFQLLASPSLEGLPAAEREAARADRLERLASAHELARRALARQPNSWQASMFQGATTYLFWSLARDPRLFTESAAWQEPLIKAWREAPSQDEPRRILGTAYLELWPVLSPEKKRFASELLAETFADDPDAFQRLGPAWLATADDLDAALAIVPDTPHGWEITGRYFAHRRMWRRWVAAHHAGLDSLERRVSALVDEGLLRLELGDAFHSRTRFARAVAEAPPDQRFVPLVDRALLAYPAGLQTAGTGNALARWLSWTLDLAEIGVPSLAPQVVDRLAGVVTSMPPPEAAVAALVGGDLVLAERLEKLDRDHTTRAWAPYLSAKAHLLLERGDVDGAEAAVARVGSVYRGSARFWQARQRIAAAREDDAAAEEAARQLARLRARAWPAVAWMPIEGRRPPSQALEIVPDGNASGFAVQVAKAPPEGCVVRLRIDGHTVLVAPAAAGDQLRAHHPLADGPHRVEWTALAGTVALPGEVRLIFDEPTTGR